MRERGVQSRGFTLVEVMVALAVVAIALPAVLMALARQTDDTAYLRDKTMAQMVAANKLAEVRVVVAATRALQAGRSNGMETMADRDWYWWVETKTTPAPQFYRVEVRVALDEERQDQPLYTLATFMSGDLAEDIEGLPGDDGDGDGDDGDEGESGGNDGSEGSNANDAINGNNRNRGSSGDNEGGSNRDEAVLGIGGGAR